MRAMNCLFSVCILRSRNMVAKERARLAQQLSENWMSEWERNTVQMKRKEREKPRKRMSGWLCYPKPYKHYRLSPFMLGKMYATHACFTFFTVQLVRFCHSVLRNFDADMCHIRVENEQYPWLLRVYLWQIYCAREYRMPDKIQLDTFVEIQEIFSPEFNVSVVRVSCQNGNSAFLLCTPFHSQPPQEYTHTEITQACTFMWFDFNKYPSRLSV